MFITHTIYCTITTHADLPNERARTVVHASLTDAGKFPARIACLGAAQDRLWRIMAAVRPHLQKEEKEEL